MEKFNFSYDIEHDDLFMHKPGSKSAGSLDYGDLILDFTEQGELMGIEFMNAQEFLGHVLDGDVVELLRSLQRCEVSIKNHKQLLIVKLTFRGSKEKISQVLTVPLAQ